MFAIIMKYFMGVPQLTYLRQGALCLGTRSQKVEALSDGQEDHHPHRSLVTPVFVGLE
jgi:hypothetical protein